MSIDGLGSATFNSANGYTAGFAPSGLFGALPILAILEFDNPSQTSFTGISGAFHALLAGNDLRHAFGPAIGTGIGIATTPNGTPVSYSTTAGALVLAGGNDRTTLTVTVNSVPEPASLLLLALGALGVIVARRERQRHTY